MKFNAIVYACFEHYQQCKHAVTPGNTTQLCAGHITQMCSEIGCLGPGEFSLMMHLEVPGSQQRKAASVKSEKKSQAVRENGKKGGRPPGSKNKIKL